MTVDASELQVLVPNPTGGVTVIGLFDLVERLSDDDLDDALLNGGIDSALTNDEVPKLVERVRALNETGDVSAYWGMT